MSKKIYVGNLSFQTTEAGLHDYFGQHGEVHSVTIVTDRDTGRSRGFAFVEMDASAAQAAIEALDQTELDGRNLKVNEAKPRENRSGGGGGGGGGGRSRW
jgi:RNA recognition motif-containing protein